MQCPYCGKQMEEGHIPPGLYGGLQWIPGKKPRLLGAWFYDDILTLGKSDSYMFGKTIPACLCRECKKIIIDYEGQSCDVNDNLQKLV